MERMHFSCEKDMDFGWPGEESYGLTVCVPPKFYTLNPPKDDGISKQGFGTCLSHEDGTFMNRTTYNENSVVMHKDRHTTDNTEINPHTDGHFSTRA